MLVGAPKAGNVWLKHLLSDLYEIPMVDVGGLVDPRTKLTGPSFVTHQHILPRKDFVSWGAEEQVHFIALARHPGDLFLSLYHYVQNYGPSWKKAGNLGSAPSHEMLGHSLSSRAVLDYLAGNFFEECLGKSLQWVDSQGTPFVRYEDLHEKGVETLQGLGKILGPLSRQHIEKTLEKHSFKRMKRFAGWRMKRHFRSGSTGEWQNRLGADHIAAIAQRHQPALAKFDYTLQVDPAAIHASSKTKGPINFFAKWFGSG